MPDHRSPAEEPSLAAPGPGRPSVSGHRAAPAAAALDPETLRDDRFSRAGLERAIQRARLAAGGARPAAAARTVLLVDGNRASRELVKVYLVAADVRVVEAADGLEALVTAERLRPDLILCEARLAHLDGAGVCRAVRQRRTLARVPVVLMTSDPDLARRQAALEAGARAVLAKPIGPQALHDALSRHAGISLGLDR